MGKPVINDDGSCVIASCTMYTEGQHRLVFERLHGHGKFTFQAKHPTNLKKRCRKKGVWDPLEGSFTKDVLNVILATQGIPTAKAPNDIFLPLRAFTIIQPDTPLNSSRGRRVQPLELAWIIYRHGPVLGDLLTDEEYENCDQETNCVYKGVLEKVLEKQLKGEGPEGLDGHVVVCYRYRFMCNATFNYELWTTTAKKVLLGGSSSPLPACLPSFMSTLLIQGCFTGGSEMSRKTFLIHSSFWPISCTTSGEHFVALASLAPWFV